MHGSYAQCRRGGAVIEITVTVDGRQYREDVEPRLLLVHFLRERLGLTATNVGCDTSNCGACTVLLDGRSAKSCTVLAVQADGGDVQTVAALASGSDEEQWHPLQRSFHREHALQCGYCTPGMLLSAVDLLRENPDPSEDEVRHGLEGNLCRCTGYQSIVDAVLAAARELRAAPDPAEQSG